MATATTPCALRKGDAIAFISPPARLNQILSGPLNRAKAHLEHLGYAIKIILDTTTPLDFQDGTSELRDEPGTGFWCRAGEHDVPECMRYSCPERCAEREDPEESDIGGG